MKAPLKKDLPPLGFTYPVLSLSRPASCTRVPDSGAWHLQSVLEALVTAAGRH